jgi:hypothetical protein
LTTHDGSGGKTDKLIAPGIEAIVDSEGDDMAANGTPELSPRMW